MEDALEEMKSERPYRFGIYHEQIPLEFNLYSVLVLKEKKKKKQNKNNTYIGLSSLWVSKEHKCGCVLLLKQRERTFTMYQQRKKKKRGCETKAKKVLAKITFCRKQLRNEEIAYRQFLNIALLGYQQYTSKSNIYQILFHL